MLPRFIADQWAYIREQDTADIHLFPNYFHPIMRRKQGLTVAVVHDLQYLHYPGNFSWKKRMWLDGNYNNTLRRADVVVAISAFVAQDLRARFHSASSARIETIPNPIDWSRFETSSGSPITGPYILSVAGQYPNKNLSTLLRAYKRLHDGGCNVPLVLVGQTKAFLSMEARPVDVSHEIAKLGLEQHVRVAGQVSDEALGSYYRGCTVFVFPSLFEGFGMPPVEALGLGKPVITTRCTALPETTLGMARYLDDPEDAAELCAAMREVLDDPAGFAPSKAQQESLRSKYDPARIARSYLRLLDG